MRILFFSHYFPPERNAPAARTLGHCKRWVAAGHHVTVVTCAPHHPRGILFPGYHNRLRQVETVEGIRVVRCLTYLAANQGTLKRSASYLFYVIAAVACAWLEPPPDAVIATSPQFFCGWAGVLFGRLRRKPLLLEIRDLWPESIEAVGALRTRSVLRLLAALERRMYQASQHIVTVAESLRESLIERGVEPRKISVVMNGVDQELFVPRAPDSALIDEFDVRGSFVVTYCGTIGMAHGLEIVLRAAVRLLERGHPKIRFLLVGDGAQMSALRDEALQRELHNVSFVGSVDRERVPAVLSISNACLIHLRNVKTFMGAMPSKIFEAAAMERPIILGVAGFARDFIEGADCGIFIEPENADQLADVVVRLAEDPELAVRLGRAGRRCVSERYGRGALADRYLRLIERLVREHRLHQE